MKKVVQAVLIGGLIALLAACGGQATTPTQPAVPTPTTAPSVAPTTVPSPTATPSAPASMAPSPAPSVAPSPTPSVAPSVAPTVAPTKAASAAPSAAGTVVKDGTGKCQMSVNPVFVPDKKQSDTFGTADELAVLIFAGTDTPGLSLDAAAGAFMTGFQNVVTNYAETGRETRKDTRGDIQIVTFTGQISGQQTKGVFYFVQKNSVLCALVGLALPGGEKYSPQLQQSTDTLQLAAAGSGNSPAGSPVGAAGVPSAAPSAKPATSAAPVASAKPATSAAPVGATGGSVTQDSDGKCQMTLPAGFNESSPGSYTSADNQVIVSLSSAGTAGLGFDTSVGIFVDTFKIIVEDYTETGNQKTPTANGQKQTITYTGSVIGQPAKGTLHFYMGGTTLCSLSVVALAGAETKNQAGIDQMVATLQTKP